MYRTKRSKALCALALVIVTLSLQACNTTAGLGRDVSSAADAVTESAEDNKGY